MTRLKSARGRAKDENIQSTKTIIKYLHILDYLNVHSGWNATYNCCREDNPTNDPFAIDEI